MLFFIHPITCAPINLVVYSYNRPLQLYGFLESFEKNVLGCDHITVIYRADNVFDQAYNVVKSRFSSVNFLKQSDDPRADFKPLTLKAIAFDQEPYILFAVDDIIVTRAIDLNKCIDAMEAQCAYAFYFRLGSNITECYMTRQQTGQPTLIHCSDNFYKWRLENTCGDWSYPHNLDMTIYRKEDIAKFFISFNYSSPNLLEGNWASIVPQKVWQSYCLCAEYSCIVNCPINRIQTDCPGNRNSNLYTPEEMLEIFNAGLKIDIEPLQAIMNKAPHMDYEPTFITRQQLILQPFCRL